MQGNNPSAAQARLTRIHHLDLHTRLASFVMVLLPSFQAVIATLGLRTL
jgi:hypothetical protein